MDSEKKIEPKLRSEIRRRKGVCWKWTSPGTRGVPDRIVLLPGGLIYFVETKSTGDSPSKLQLIVHNILRRLGFKVYVIDTMNKLWEFLKQVDSDLESI